MGHLSPSAIILGFFGALAQSAHNLANTAPSPTPTAFAANLVAARDASLTTRLTLQQPFTDFGPDSA